MSNPPTVLDKLQHRLTRAREHYRLNTTFPPRRIATVKESNRKWLSCVANWIDERTLQESVFNYGIPVGQEALVDSTIDSYTTYSDLLGYLALRLDSPVNYLEIGVSVGKNLWQMCNLFVNANITGMDIERINPILEKLFKNKSTVEWKGNPELLRPDASTSYYQYASNKIVYHCMDEFDAEGWMRLDNKAFNVIFSDALHDPIAILYEFEMLNKLNLINRENFIMMWDDLGGNMSHAFNQIYMELNQEVRNLKKYRFITNGWMNLKSHQVGIITNIHLK